MKKLLSLTLVLLLIPLASLADPGVALCYRMNFYAAAYNDAAPGSFNFDTMIVDVYFMDDFTTAYYSRTTWSSAGVETTGLTRCAVSSGPDSKHTLSFPNGEKMYFFYDDAGEFWLEMENGTYRLLPCERFDLQKDLK